MTPAEYERRRAEHARAVAAMFAGPKRATGKYATADAALAAKRHYARLWQRRKRATEAA